MTIAISHSTAADGTFSAAGKTAWEAAHSLSGSADLSQGGTNNNATPGAGQLIWSDGTKYTSDANLTWSASTGLLSKKGISSKPASTGTGTEIFGLGSVDNSTIGRNTLVGAAITQNFLGGDESDNTLVGYGITSGGHFSAAVGANITLPAFGYFHSVVGSNNSITSNQLTVIGYGNTLGSGSAVAVCAGTSNTIAPGGSIGCIGIFGKGNQVTADGAMAVGQNLVASVPYELNFGFVYTNKSEPSIRLTGLADITNPFVPRDIARWKTVWVNTTDATRKGRVIHSVYDTAEREYMRGEASGSAPMIGFFGANAVVQPATTGTSTGFTAGAGTNVTHLSTFTGNSGSAAYTIGDIVLALKQLGLMTA